MYLFQRLIAINEESLYKMCYYSVKMRISAPLLRFKQSWAKKVWNWCSGKHLASGSASLILLGMKVGVVASSQKKKNLLLFCISPAEIRWGRSPWWPPGSTPSAPWSDAASPYSARSDPGRPGGEKNINKRGRKEGEERRNSNEGLQFCKYNALIQQAYWG